MTHMKLEEIRQIAEVRTRSGQDWDRFTDMLPEIFNRLMSIVDAAIKVCEREELSDPQAGDWVTLDELRTAIQELEQK